MARGRPRHLRGTPVACCEGGGRSKYGDSHLARPPPTPRTHFFPFQEKLTMALTDKKRRFVDALLSGATNREAAIAAGYSEKTASQAGSKLAKDEDVLTEVGRRLKQKQATSSEVKPGRKVKGEDVAEEEQAEVALTHTDDPRVFLTELMNANGADMRMRLEAAKTLMPYAHGKVADQGKKEQKAEAAKEAGKGKYSQGKPPPGKPSLSMVKG